MSAMFAFADLCVQVSARVTDGVYKISGTDGSVIWRMGGKRSDFDVEPAATFAFQHDAHWIDREKQDQMTIFDNGPHGDVEYSRGMLLAVDQSAKTVHLLTEFRNRPSTFAQFEGNLQAINPGDPNTNFIVGYGLQPHFTEFSSDGTVLLDGQFGTATVVNNYRAFKLPWQGKPLDKPSINWDASTGKVLLSWNGATDHENWVSGMMPPRATCCADRICRFCTQPARLMRLLGQTSRLRSRGLGLRRRLTFQRRIPPAWSAPKQSTETAKSLAGPMLLTAIAIISKLLTSTTRK
jgi:Arylsulfotransferase (ASST)